MAPRKKSPTTSNSASGGSSTAARKSAAKKSAAKKSAARPTRASTPKKAAGAAKKAAEPLTRAAGAARRATTGNADSATRGEGRQPDAIRVLTDDHREVEELFVRFEKTGAGAQKRRQDIVQRIIEALSVHASIEEEIFYPAARRIAG